MTKNRKNYGIYILMLAIFGTLIYWALDLGEKFSHPAISAATAELGDSAFTMFKNVIINNLESPLTVLLFQIIVILVAVRIFSHLFKYIRQPGVIGEIVAGIVLGPSLLGYFFPEFFNALFPADSLMNLELLSQIGLVLFMFVIGMDVDFSLLKTKMNETLVISHAGIIIPFFLGIIASYWIYEEYAASYTDYLPFALFIGISMSITAFPVLARIIQERNMTKSPVGVLSIASAANDDVTAWCLLAIVIAVAKAGTFVSALYTVGLTLLFIGVMFGIVRPFLKKIGDAYANSEVINKSFVGFIFLILVISSIATEIIGIHALFGAFIAGVVMPVNMGFRKVMMEKVEDIALIFFLPLFFAFTGLRTEIGLINTPALWGVCGLLIFIAILGKLGGCTIAARLVGESWKDSFTIGTLMNTRGLMELVALNIGYEMGILPPQIFVILILMALSTTFMTTPLLGLVDKVFKSKPVPAPSRRKILLSFGRPESGKILLSIAHLLFSKRLEETDLIAAHYTVGADLNPEKAKQFADESFKPLDEESKRLKLKVDKRYKVTDRLTHEMAELANKEKADFMLIGAGPRFMQASNALSPHHTLDTLNFQQLIEKFRNQSFRLSGNLLKDKLQAVIEHVQGNVAVFVNRKYTETRQLLLALDGENDLAFFNYARQLLGNYTGTIHLCTLSEAPLSAALQASIAEAGTEAPGRFATGNPISSNALLRQQDSLLIVSYETCRKIAQDNALFSVLPSLLIIHHCVNTEE